MRCKPLTTLQNQYDIGIYGPGFLGGATLIPLVCHSGATAGTSFCASTGVKTIALSGAPFTLLPGWYGWALTSGGATPALVCGGNNNVAPGMFSSVATSTAGGNTLPSTLTAPATAVTNSNQAVNLLIY